MVKDSFKYYQENYALRKQLDNRKGVYYWFPLFLTALIFTVSGLFLIFKIIFNSSFKNHFKENKTLTFIFSHNQSIVHNNIQTYGFEMPYVLFIKKSVLPYSDGLYIGNKTILLAMLSEAPNLLIALFESLNNPVIFNNLIRTAKLIGLKPIFEKLVKGKVRVIQYNDHTPYNVLLNKISQENKIKTVYMQHAPVNNTFPDLYHDLNVLYSEHSVDQYRNSNNKEVFNLFDLRFLNSLNHTRNTEKSHQFTILICTNLFDDVQQILKLISLFNKEYAVILRPHPADNRNSFIEDSKISISRNNTIWHDLSRSDIVLTNESAVPLEAIYFNNFIKKGLITKEYNDMNDLLTDIDNKFKPFDESKLKYFIGEFDKMKQKLIELEDKIFR